MLFTRAKNKSSTSQDRNGFFASFDAAKTACPTHYEDPRLLDIVSKKTKILREQLQNTPTLVADYSTTRILLVIQSLLARSTKLRVLDLGGACGAHYFRAKAFFPERVQFRWAVAETPSLAALARSHFSSDELQFFGDPASAQSYLGGIDLIFLVKLLAVFAQSVGCNPEGLTRSEAPFLYLTRVPVSATRR